MLEWRARRFMRDIAAWSAIRPRAQSSDWARSTREEMGAEAREHSEEGRMNAVRLLEYGGQLVFRCATP